MVESKGSPQEQCGRQQCSNGKEEESDDLQSMTPARKAEGSQAAK